MRVKRDGRVVRKLRDVAAGGGETRRVDLTIPQEIMARALVKPGASVELRVIRGHRILLLPIRPDWPPRCRRLEGCLLADGHADGCLTDAEVPY